MHFLPKEICPYINICFPIIFSSLNAVDYQVTSQGGYDSAYVSISTSSEDNQIIVNIPSPGLNITSSANYSPNLPHTLLVQVNEVDSSITNFTVSQPLTINDKGSLVLNSDNVGVSMVVNNSFKQLFGDVTIHNGSSIEIGNGGSYQFGPSPSSTSTGGTLNLGGNNPIFSSGGAFIINGNGQYFRVIDEDLYWNLNATFNAISSTQPGCAFDTNGFNATLTGTINSTTNLLGVPVLAKTGNGNLAFDHFTFSGGGEIHISQGTASVSGNSTIHYISVGSQPGGQATMNFSDPGMQLKIQTVSGNGTAAIPVGDFLGVGIVNHSAGTIILGGTLSSQGASISISNQGGTGTYNLTGGTININNGSILNIGRNTGTNLPSVGVLNLSGAGKIYLIGPNGTLVLGSNTSGATMGYSSGVLNQTGGLIQVGSGCTFYLSRFGAGIYNFSGGILEAGGTTSIQTGTNSYVFNFGNGTIRTINSNLTIAANMILSDNQNGSIDTNGFNTILSGNLSGNGGLIKNGSGTLTLTGTNSYYGTNTINQGTLKAGGSALSSNAALNINGGTVDLNNLASTVKGLSGIGGTLNIGSGSLINNSTVSTIFQGVIAGSGNFTQQGVGHLTLSGNNSSYTGVMKVSGSSAALEISSNNNLGTGNLILDANSNLITNGTFSISNAVSLTGTGGIITVNGSNADQVTISGNITGGNRLTKSGLGILKLLGLNTYSGFTTCNQGTLLAGGSALSSNAAVSINGGILDLNNLPSTINGFSGNGGMLNIGSGSIINTSTISTIFQGVITGSGSFTQQGVGILTLSGDNSGHTGPVNLLGSSVGIAISASNNITKGNLSLKDNAQLITNGSFALPNVVSFTGTGGKIIVNGSDIDRITLSGNITGSSGLTKLGLGILELIGTNNYLGSTDVQGGTLLINAPGSIGNQTVHVASGARLGGTGTIGTGMANVNNFGMLSPGNSPGTLTINGSYTQAPNGSMSLELLNSSRYSQLIVNTGSVHLDGGLNLILDEGFAFDALTTLVLIDNSNGSGIHGTFLPVTTFGFPPIATYEINYDDPQFVTLSLFAPALPNPPLDSVSYVGPVLTQTYQNTINSSRRLARLRSQMRTPSINQISVGKLNSSNIATTLDMIESNESLNIDKSADNQEVQGVIVSSPTTLLEMNDKRTRSWGIFAEGLGSMGRVYKISNQNPYEYYSAGGSIGFDYVGEGYGLGFTPGYQMIHANITNSNAQFDIQSATGTFFATFLPSACYPLYIDLIFGGAAQWYEFERETFFGDIKGKPFGGTWNMYGDIGYTFTKGNGRLIPFLGVGFVDIYVPSYHESGSIIRAFEIGKQNTKSLRSSLGLTVNYAMKNKCISFVPEMNFLWQYEFLNQPQQVSFGLASYAISSQMEIVGLGKNSVLTGGALRVLMGNGFEFDASYDYEYNSKFHSHLLYLNAKKTF